MIKEFFATRGCVYRPHEGQTFEEFFEECCSDSLFAKTHANRLDDITWKEKVLNNLRDGEIFGFSFQRTEL